MVLRERLRLASPDLDHAPRTRHEKLATRAAAGWQKREKRGKAYKTKKQYEADLKEYKKNKKRLDSLMAKPRCEWTDDDRNFYQTYAEEGTDPLVAPTPPATQPQASSRLPAIYEPAQEPTKGKTKGKETGKEQGGGQGKKGKGRSRESTS